MQNINLIPNQTYIIHHPDGRIEAVFKHTQINIVTESVDLVFEINNAEFRIPVVPIPIGKDTWGVQTQFMISGKLLGCAA